MPATAVTRSPLTVTLSVWRALFLREAASRLARGRAAWVWLLVEPLFQFALIMFIFAALRLSVVGGIDKAVWILVGLLAFFMFRRTFQQTRNAVGANQMLFTYRQIKPVDVVLVRAGLEGFLMIVVAIVVLSSATFYGFDVFPENPLVVLAAFFGMWLIGLALGLTASAANELARELGRFINLCNRPLFIASGVVFPIGSIPPPYSEWLMFNPLAHGLEVTRRGFASHYQAHPETSIAYVYFFALIFIFFALAWHRRLATRMVTE